MLRRSSLPSCVKSACARRLYPRTLMVAHGSTTGASAPTAPPGYRPNVGICLFNKQGLVFTAKRVKEAHGAWQMPQGGIDPGEDAADACLRELKEETSIFSVQIIGRTDRWLSYDFPPEVKARLHGSWTQLKGQAQLWFLLKFEGDESEINLDVQHKEFSEWRWMPLEESPQHVISFKRGVYEQVVREFAPVIRQHISAPK